MFLTAPFLALIRRLCGKSDNTADAATVGQDMGQQAAQEAKDTATQVTQDQVQYVALMRGTDHGPFPMLFFYS